MDPAVFPLILEDRAIAYFIADTGLTVVESGGALNICGNQGQTFTGHSLLDVIPELVGSEQVLAGILTGIVPRFRLPWINRETTEGQTAYLTMVDLPYRDEAGQIAGLIHLVQDVTEMGRLEQQLTQQRNDLRLLQDQLTRQNLELAAANAELRRLDDLKSQFVSVAAHELRSPLSSIIGYVEILLDQEFDPLTDHQREFLETVRRNGQRLLAITKNLLDVNRIEAGRVELLLEPADLAGLVASVAAEFAPQLEVRAQRLALGATPGLPLVWCDEIRAAQIVSNLLSNAIKYTPDGGLITIRVGPAGEEGFLQVAVADDGVGISPEDQTRLFNRFFRAGSASLTGASGTGLGLYITRSLVELHGGRIWLESEPGKGSTFYVTFPIAEMQPA